jgi:hypothetical protein
MMNRKLSLTQKGNRNNGIIFHHRNNSSKRNISKIHNKPINRRPPVSTQKTITVKPNRPGAKPLNVVSREKAPVKSTPAVRVSRFTQSRRPRRDFTPDKNQINTIRDVGIGKFLVILAPGPSILESDISRFRNIPGIDTMTINKPDKRCWKTDYWMFCDRSQYYRNKDKFDSYNNTIINSNSIDRRKNNQIRIKTITGKGFSTDMHKGFYIGRSTTYSSMQVALWMGYEKIFIFGCDMCRVEVDVNGQKKSLLHSYGVNPDVPESTRIKRFKEEAKFYDNASKIMSKGQREKFYFCSSYNKWPFVDRYNRIDHKVAVDEILNILEEFKNG